MSRRVGIVVLLAIAVLALLPTAASAASASPPPTMFSVSDPDAFPGVHSSDQEIRQLRAGFIRAAKSMGATHVRIWVLWQYYHECHPPAERARRVRLLLSSIDQAIKAGLEPMISFTGVATLDYGGQCAGMDPLGLNPTPTEYAWFVTYITNLVARHPYNVRIYETYNEPNLSQFLCVLPPKMHVKGGDARRFGPYEWRAKKKSGTGGFGARVAYAHYRLGRNVYTRTCKHFREGVGVRRYRQIHQSAATAITAVHRRIGVPRSQIRILFGDVSGDGLGYLRWALRDVRKLDADGIAIHPYWHKYSAEVPGRCVSSKVPDNYLGMECIWRVRKLLLNRARRIRGIGTLPIWSTEAGLHTGEEQEADPDNVRLAMERQYTNTAGVAMVNWYDIHTTGTGTWQTWIVNRNGDPCVRWSADGQTCVFAPAVSIREWAKGKFPVSDDWLPAEPAQPQCADGTFPKVDAWCDLPDPPAPR